MTITQFHHPRSAHYQPKTSRRWGASTGFMRARIAEVGGTFTWRTFCPPLEHETAYALLKMMVSRGEIKRVTPGKPGRFSARATEYERI